jgi:DNA helicase-2/ATP-dependent DNA helicase PcrA
MRFAYLILEKGVAPESILAITFTNKAAGEMRERLTALLDSPRPSRFSETSKVSLAGRVTIKTFHAFGALLLREHAVRLGLTPEFAILAEEDRAALLRQACPELKQGQIEDVLAEISAAKSRILGREAMAEARSNDFSRSGSHRATEVATTNADIYLRYQAALRAGDAVDFDDLILLPVRLLEEHPDVLAAVQARYRWISVDEYQDVNLAQYRLLRLLTELNPREASTLSHGDWPEGRARSGEQWSRRALAERPSPDASSPAPAVAPAGAGAGVDYTRQTAPGSAQDAGVVREVNLCVIGDPDQAIYGFRGADRRYFLQFEQDYPGTVTLSLSRNYRSSQHILDAASQVIARNPDRKSIEILSEFADEVKIDVHRAPTDRAEAEYVVHQIEQMVGGTSYFSLDSGRADGATPAAARSFADFAVLYRLSAQSRLLVEAFDRSGIPYQTVGQTPLCSQKVVREVLAYLWLLQNPRSRVHLAAVLAAGKPVLAVGQFAKLPDDSLRDALSAAAASGNFSAAQRRRLVGLATFWRELEGARGVAPVARLIEQVSQFTAQEQSESLSDVDAERLRQLALRAVPFENRLADFLESTVLQSETDAYDPRADRVTLMTLHAAKGLEFPVVFIVGCEEGLLPYVRGDEAPDVEEERRLFYVGMTRARNKLVLTYTRTRFLFGLRMENAPSRFVSDIEAALKEIQEMKYKRPEQKPESGQLSLF